MIHQTVERWHSYMKGELPGGLDELLDNDVIFYSPIVFTPQHGKEITTLYLTAAAGVFPGDDQLQSSASSQTQNSPFHYTKKTFGENSAILEFETTMEGKYVNGVDIITCNDEGKIVEFRVMIRPLQAVNLVHEQMSRMLDQLNG